MGDMGDFYRDWDAYVKEKKAERHGDAQKVFFDAWQGPPMPGWTRHTPYHWSRMLDADRMDYWPSTGKWRWRGKTYYGTPYDTANFIAKREQNDGSRDE